MTEAGVDHNTPRHVGGAKETLLAFLEYLRGSALRKLDGLAEEQARWSPVPSGTSLLRLVKHLAFVESYWVQRRFAGIDTGEIADDGFALAPSDTLASVSAAYEEACRRSDELLAGAPIDAPLARARGELTLTWVLVHLVEETGRHAGHADILRELIDGAVGR
ncbi:MAG: DinB family protein [Acidimicrobiales bacterium]